MTDWIVRRWARYGNERLYAATPGGTDLGYLDLKTGRYHSDDISNMPLLERAIADHLESASSVESGQGPFIETTKPESPSSVECGRRPCIETTEPELSSSVECGQGPCIETTEPTWHDISSVPAGAAAREQAIAERAAQGTLRNGIARLIGAKTDERAWRIGADGEEAVAAQLAKLGPAWHVLHAVRVGERGSDIDHVVIGPCGVFTVNAKHHPRASIWVGGDTFMVNGKRVPYVRNSRHEASRASRLLTEQVGFPVTVTGIIAVMGARGGYKVKKQPEGGAVRVVTRREIARFLLKQPQALDVRAVEAIFEVARRDTTWR